MKFSEKYPTLFQLFAGYFHDASFEGLSETEVISNYALDHLPDVDVLNNTVFEIDNLILEVDFYFDIIGTEANVYFENKESALNWLERIKLLLSEFIKQ